MVAPATDAEPDEAERLIYEALAVLFRDAVRTESPESARLTAINQLQIVLEGIAMESGFDYDPEWIVAPEAVYFVRKAQ